MLSRLLAERGTGTLVESAGFISEGAPCPAEVDVVMKRLGYDLSGHRSRIVGESMLQHADLIIGMTRQHVIDLSLRAPEAWSRTFTITEVAKLGDRAGPRRPTEGLASWVARVGESRTRSGLVGLHLSDDVPDPIGRPLSGYVRTRDLLTALCFRLADLLAPV